MTVFEKHSLPILAKASPTLENTTADSRGYDPELLYVECLYCGSPVLWEPGRSTALVKKAGLSRDGLDSGHLILTLGCPVCSPDEIMYETRIMPVELAMVNGMRDDSEEPGEMPEISGNC